METSQLPEVRFSFDGKRFSFEMNGIRPIHIILPDGTALLPRSWDESSTPHRPMALTVQNHSMRRATKQEVAEIARWLKGIVAREEQDEFANVERCK